MRAGRAPLLPTRRGPRSSPTPDRIRPYPPSWSPTRSAACSPRDSPGPAAVPALVRPTPQSPPCKRILFYAYGPPVPQLLPYRIVAKEVPRLTDEAQAEDDGGGNGEEGRQQAQHGNQHVVPALARKRIEECRSQVAAGETTGMRKVVDVAHEEAHHEQHD